MLKTARPYLFFIVFALAHNSARADFQQDLTATGNISTSLRELHARAAAGNIGAQLTMGGVFCRGEAIEQDFVECAKWFRLAAHQGNPQAQFNLGMMYTLGQGVAQDQSEAARWYRLAAVQGLALAQINLGVAYATGQGVVQNEAEAAKWTRLAAIQGEAQAQFNIAVMYANGQGVKQDFAEAYRWAKLAAAQNNDTAAALAQDLALRMNAEQASNPALNAIPSGSSSEKGEYYLQLAAFKSPAEAEKYVAAMRNNLGNIDGSLSIFTSDGWIRTQIGPYPSLIDARLKAKHIKSKLGYEPLLKRR